MAVPQVAIVGRPNVGKSSLFNWLAGRRIAIVDPTPGVTRDRLATLVQAGRRYFEVIDTGGMGIQDSQNLTVEIEGQIQTAIDRAEVVLFVVDVRTGPVPLDEEVVSRLRGIDKPIVVVANKCDYPHLEAQVAEFYRFGFGDILCVSAQQNRGKQELLDAICKRLPKTARQAPANEEPALKLAIVGRRNTGKSTFINCLADEARTIVSEVAGTTRDSVDVRFEKDGKTIVAIDTAGVRYKGKIQDSVEFYSMARAERSIRRADVVLHFLDAREKISLVDKQLAGYVLEQYKPTIFVMNKWDLVKNSDEWRVTSDEKKTGPSSRHSPLATRHSGIPTGAFADYLHQTFPSLTFVPIAFITAKSGKNVNMVLDLAQNLNKQTRARVTTGELNRVIKLALAHQTPPTRQNRIPRIYFGTQVAVQPPTLVLFTNGPELFDPTYRRYLENTFRDHLPFKDVPIKMYLRARAHTEEGQAIEADKKAKKSGKKSGGVWKDL